MKILLYLTLVFHLSLSLKHAYLLAVLIHLPSPSHSSSELKETNLPSDLYPPNCITLSSV